MNNILRKLKAFFYKLFNKKQELLIEDKKKQENNFLSSLSYRKELDKVYKEEKLAEELKEGKLDVYELDDNQTEEMIEYFDKDIDNKKKELERIKNHIIEIRKELLNG